MQKRVLDLGNCSMDHRSISGLLTQVSPGVEVVRCHSLDDALRSLQERAPDLILVNRKLDRDGSDGMIAIETFREDYPSVPVMLITNYPEYQAKAVEIGALEGFGKQSLSDPETRRKLGAVLTEKTTSQKPS